ncbi:MAG: tRNA pseudouridine synthase A, partial [Candidatus Eremiobacteraeota bacterium]|nr:tRNA pseudouridine synthase A [Candidatus Eremiobacteraeota bacterium]
MRRLALWLEYDGGRFGGFQRLTRRRELKIGTGNPRLWKPQETIQEELETKLSLILGEPIKISGSGRTDRGVHASGQVVACDTSSPKEAGQILRSLRAILAPGIRVERAQWMDPKFHPRFSAQERVYHYYLWPGGPQKSPWWEAFCWMLQEKLDLEAMRRAARLLLGSHDFSAYTRSPEPGEVKIRHLKALEVRSQVLHNQLTVGPWAGVAQMICLEVRANAFLRRMVRQLVANLVEVGRGRWPETRPHEVLLSLDASRGAAPPPPPGGFGGGRG